MAAEALRVHAVEALLAEAEELLMKHRSDLRLSSLVDSSEEALLDAAATSTPLRRSRAFSLPARIYDTGYDTMGWAYGDDKEDDVYDPRK